MKNEKIDIQHKTNKRWAEMGKTIHYRMEAIREACRTTSQKIEIELLDGIFLNLDMRNQEKSRSVQNRLIRRIIEKRRAQAVHKMSKGINDIPSCHLSIEYTSRTIEHICRKRRVA